MTGDEWVYGVLGLVPLAIAGASLYVAYRIGRLPGQLGWMEVGRLMALFLLTGTVWIAAFVPVAVGLSLGQTDWAGIQASPGDPGYLLYQQLQKLTSVFSWTLGNLWYLPVLFALDVLVVVVAKPHANRLVKDPA
jgi:hypothetical protein